MIDEAKVTELVNSRIKGSELFLVEVNIGSANEIRVLIDSMKGVIIDECVALSRFLTDELNKVDENFSLEVSSPGLGSPLLISMQYQKNVGREVEVVLKDGTKKNGLLKSAGEESVIIEVREKKFGPGSQKKKKYMPVEKEFNFEDIKSTKVVVKF